MPAEVRTSVYDHRGQEVRFDQANWVVDGDTLARPIVRTVGRQYDNRRRLTAETMPEDTLRYAYDDLDHKVSNSVSRLDVSDRTHTFGTDLGGHTVQTDDEQGLPVRRSSRSL